MYSVSAKLLTSPCANKCLFYRIKVLFSMSDYGVDGRFNVESPSKVNTPPPQNLFFWSNINNFPFNFWSKVCIRLYLYSIPPLSIVLFFLMLCNSFIDAQVVEKNIPLMFLISIWLKYYYPHPPDPLKYSMNKLLALLSILNGPLQSLK